MVGFFMMPNGLFPAQHRALERKERIKRRAEAAAASRGPSGAQIKTRLRLASMRKRAEEKGLEFDLTEEWLQQKMDATHCEATRIPFAGAGAEPFSRTIDRFDNSLGYTMANCWVVCWIYNRCKLDGKHEDVMRMARALCE